MPGHDLTADRLAMRTLARRAACIHAAAVEVISAGELVAWLCPQCDLQLAATWIPPRCDDCHQQLGQPFSRLGRYRVCAGCARKIAGYGLPFPSLPL